MANVYQKSLKYPNLPNTYLFVQPDGSYEQMTVGNAEQLVSTVGIEDSTPYLLRTTGGSADIGDRVKLSKITGGTVAWNQLSAPSDYEADKTENNCTYAKQNDGSVKVTVSATVTQVSRFKCSRTNLFVNGHKYLATIGGNYGSDKFNVTIGITNYSSIAVGANGLYSAVFTINADASSYILAISTRVGCAAGTYTLYPQIFDLTQMFGSTIADYILSLETATPGAGVALLKAWNYCTKPYYAYNAGELMHVQTSAHKMVGFNAFDKSKVVANERFNANGTIAYSGNYRSEYIRCVPNADYYFKNIRGVSIMNGVFWYDAAKQYIDTASVGLADPSSGIAHSPNNACYVGINFTSAYIDSVCVNLHWDGERDGEYEPYEEHSYPLDDVELRGIPKLDANNNLYYDGDTYEADGTVTRKYAQLTLNGTEQWGKDGSIDGELYYRFYMSLDTMKRYTDYRGKIINNKAYETATGYSSVTADIGNYAVTAYSANAGTNAGRNWFYVFVKTTLGISDAAAFKTWLASNPITVLYELATPTTESADPYQETQICNDFGTEEFIDTRTVPIPVGYTALYQPNLRAKLEMAPDSPADGDGDYIVRQTNGDNSYVKLIIPTELPANPSTDGSYHLKATVANGTTTLSWEADT